MSAVSELQHTFTEKHKHAHAHTLFPEHTCDPLFLSVFFPLCIPQRVFPNGQGCDIVSVMDSLQPKQTTLLAF